ncbi:putative nucleic acid-binding Zn-ribbon protein [Kibdelosporangium banguiense]|uniref:Nucleic acid-binding Zn-ribbon protein n=1 Tax=Kibdelosporangium banguiense TaxID=1365924 RepID=A0ABS4T960_9PSEU|nr:C4-type zinc ribbon domain-containing protein [Kibdelosporangium banguiense]MBP2320630.1 putative nucleic acid-binding Zn-ribbon protein [Kibdelosporangium banguiense]
MKADPAVQRRLLDLAEADAELARIEHRRRTLPEIAEIAAAEQNERTKRDAQVAVTTQLGDIDREVKRQEKEIDQVRARTEKDNNLLQSGTVAAKQMTDIEHEIETLKRRQGALEDDLLELMERREALEMDSQHADAELGKAEAAVVDATQRRDEVFADLATQEARATERRSAMLPEFPDPLLALYNRVREHKGTGAALLRSRRCGACRLELDRVVISQIKAAAADDVVNCEECGAILVRTGESGL